MFMTVVMLNLMIAVMSSVYEESQVENFVSKYQFRCEMMAEATMIKEGFSIFSSLKRSLIFNLTFSILHDENEEEDTNGL
jgi:hypothetical protein